MIDRKSHYYIITSYHLVAFEFTHTEILKHYYCDVVVVGGGNIYYFYYLLFYFIVCRHGKKIFIYY